METPDFEQIARTICRGFVLHDANTADSNDVKEVTEQLRLVWNARGSADIAKLDVVVGSLYGLVLSEKPMKSAIRELDR